MDAQIQRPTSAEVSLRTLEKGLAVLEELASSGRRGMGTPELRDRLGMNRTTLQRFLTTLAHHGYVEHAEDAERYRLGLKALVLASATIAGLSLRDVGAPILEELWRVTDENVYIVVLDDGNVVTVEHLQAEHLITLRTGIGVRRPAYCTAAGRAILAFLPDEVTDAILEKGMPARTPKTITDPRALKAELRGVRLHGYAIDDEELAEGMRCVAAPVFDFSGSPVGAVSLSAPTLRASLERLTDLSVPITEAARRISRQLGYRASAGR